MVYDYSNFNSDDEKNSIGDDKVSIWYKWYVEDPKKFIKMNSKYVLYSWQNSQMDTCKSY